MEVGFEGEVKLRLYQSCDYHVLKFSLEAHIVRYFLDRVLTEWSIVQVGKWLANGIYR